MKALFAAALLALATVCQVGYAQWSTPSYPVGPETNIFPDGKVAIAAKGNEVVHLSLGYPQEFDPPQELVAAHSPDGGLTWDDVTTLSELRSSGGFSLCRDGDNGWIAAWSEHNDENYRLNVAHSTDGKNWQTTLLETGVLLREYLERPPDPQQIASDRNGNVVLCLAKFVITEFDWGWSAQDVYMTRSSDGGHNFGQRELLFQEHYTQWNLHVRCSDLQVSSQGTWGMIINTRKVGFYNYSVSESKQLASFSHDGVSWAPAQLVAMTGRNFFLQSGTLAQDGNGNWITMYTESEFTQPERIFEKRSTDDGHTWSDATPVIPDDPNVNETNPRLVADSFGTWMLVWNQQRLNQNNRNMVTHSYDFGETWSSPELLGSDEISNYSASLVTHDGLWVAAWATFDAGFTNPVVSRLLLSPEADLSGEVVTGSPVYTGGDAELRFRITNNGPNTAKNARARLLLPYPCTIQSSSHPVARVGWFGNTYAASLGDLLSGESVDIVLAVHLSRTGTTTLGVDVNTDTADPDLGNNEARKSVQVTRAPADLTGSIRLGSPVRGRLPVIVNVQNLGPGSSSMCVVRTYLSDDDVVDGSDKVIGFRFIGPLANGGSVSSTAGYTTPAAIAGKRIIAQIDATNKVAETDESNNLAVLGTTP